MSKKYKTIAIDCDDVLVETAAYIIDHYNNTYGTHMQLTDYYSNDHDNVWGTADEDTAIRRVKAYLRSSTFEQLPPVQDAQSVLATLTKRYDVHMVTGRADFMTEVTEMWVKEHFPNIFVSHTFTNFFTTSDDLARKVSKSEACQRLGADILIEDHLHHALDVATCGIEVLLFGNYPWNQMTEALPDNIHRVKNWKEVEEFLNAAG